MDKLSIKDKWQNWELTQELGSGSHGKVWLGEKTDPRGNTAKCVIKEVLMAPKKEPIKEAMELGISVDDLDGYFDVFKENFQKELDSYSKADSPHLAKYEDAEFANNEDVPGWTGYVRRGLYKTLTEHFEGKPTGEKEAVLIAKDLCQALAEYERKGLVHGGISINNIMADEKGNFLLTDHGIAKCSITAGDRLFNGDRSYDAPEVVEKRAYSHASDIYSLGMSLKAIANNGELPRGDLWRMASSEKFASILDRATAENPKDRFRTAADLLHAIETMGREPVRAVTPDISEAVLDDESEERKKVGKKGIIIGAASAVIAIIAAILLITKPWASKNTPEPTKTQETETTEQTVTETETVTTEPEAISEPDAAHESEPEKTEDDKEVAIDDIIDIDDDTEKLMEDAQGEETALENPEAYAVYDLDSRVVTTEELDGMNRFETYLLLDGIYAKHGKIFPDEDLQQYFEKLDWYAPVTPSSEEVIQEFSATEIRNLNIIVRYQVEHGYRNI